MYSFQPTQTLSLTLILNLYIPLSSELQNIQKPNKRSFQLTTFNSSARHLRLGKFSIQANFHSIQSNASPISHLPVCYTDRVQLWIGSTWQLIPIISGSATTYCSRTKYQWTKSNIDFLEYSHFKIQQALRRLI